MFTRLYVVLIATLFEGQLFPASLAKELSRSYSKGFLGIFSYSLLGLDGFWVALLI